MNQRENRRAALGRLCLAPLAAAAALESTSAIAAAQTPVHVRVGAVPNDFATPMLYALDSGMFRDAGLDVEFQVVNSGTAVAAALAGGSIDFGIVSLFAVITAHARGVPLTLVAGCNLYLSTAPAVGVLVAANSPIHSPADLDGKTVSSSALNDILATSIKGWVDRSGGHSDTMQFVELTGTQVAVALDAGRIAAAAVANPTLASLVATGRYRNIGDPSLGIAPRFLATAWLSSPDYVQKNPAVIKSFTSVLAKADAFANTHPDQTAPVLAKYSGIELTTVAHMTRARYTSALDPQEIQPVIDVAAKYKVIPKGFSARDIIAAYS
ncbi:MAG: ABC transporter substrate-binding protein [Candidatus Lustribacter sp.]|jgi:NitT/TauT family transport system substrate-binding protein